MKFTVLSMITLLLIGCSDKQIYNSVQENRRMECGKLPQNQYEECMRDYSTSYEDYERARQASINDESMQ